MNMIMAVCVCAENEKGGSNDDLYHNQRED